MNTRKNPERNGRRQKSRTVKASKTKRIPFFNARDLKVFAAVNGIHL